MNNRAKGLNWCREVKKILLDIGHKVEGPGYGIVYTPSKAIPIHKDYFGCLDLMSYQRGIFYGHQITNVGNKASRQKKMEQAEIVGWLWIRDKNKNRIRWRIIRPEFDKPIEIFEEIKKEV